MMSIKQIIMNSKIRVDYDFEKQNPFIQLTVLDGDLNDRALQRFIDEIRSRGVELFRDESYPADTILMLRPMKSDEQEPKIVAAFEQMCIESTSPDNSQALENILCELRNNRRALKI